MYNPFNFYVVFNPLLNGNSENYKTQAHEFYQKLKENLLSGDPSKSHYYWGKLKVSQTDQPINFENFKMAVERNNERGVHTHLFISDFHHFWVAKVESVHQEVFDKENTLPFYDGKEVEIWFKISDMDLISSEYVETGYYLEQLYCQNELDPHSIQSINPYLSGLRYPLIVQDRLNEHYFVHRQEQKTRALGRNPLIQNPSASGKVANAVQAYVLPPAIYGKLSEQIKKQLIAIEMEISQKDKPEEGQNHLIAKNYRMILEHLLNDTFIRHLREEFGGQLGIVQSNNQIRLVDENWETKLENFLGNIPIENIFELIDNPFNLKQVNLDSIFANKKKFWKYCRTELKILIEENSIHQPFENPSQKEAMIVRNVILGVGCKGIINSLICLYFEEEFMDSYFRKVA